MGVADQVKAKSRRIEGEPVAAVVARGEADIGFQQISELLPVPGIDYVGPLPNAAQNETVMTAAVAMSARSPKAAGALVEFLSSTAVGPSLKRRGFTVMSDRNDR